ncbi:hypothetical protein HD806DRAFT_535129 [Xylariaceae sp. AK1471]|nr:hypothetical protein HD806DRAFT_535129 [Xylariaceae sp. AK1471]
MAFASAPRYSLLASRDKSPESCEEDERLVDENDHPERTEAQLLKPRYSVYIFRLFPIFPWILAFMSTGLLLYILLRGPDERTCRRLLNPYSPAIEDGIVEYYDTDFENEFAHKTKYRGPPTPELEAAWDQIWNLGGVEVPLDGPARLGKSSDDLYTWRDYYNDNLREWLDDGENHQLVDLNVSSHHSVGDRMHVDHCIETLRLQLMCNADLTPMLVLKDDTIALGSKADFNVHHKCRRWDRLVAWQSIDTTDKEASGSRPS